MPPGKAGFANDLRASDLTLEKVERLLEAGPQRHVPVGMGGEVIAVALDALDQQGKALPIRHHADLVEANGLFSDPMLHGPGKVEGGREVVTHMGAWVARIVAVVKHLPVLPPAQAVIEGVHQLPRARSDVSPGHILPAIESVLAQGILCTEGVYLTAVFLLASRPPLPCASIEGATRKRS